MLRIQTIQHSGFDQPEHREGRAGHEDENAEPENRTDPATSPGFGGFAFEPFVSVADGKGSISGSLRCGEKEGSEKIDTWAGGKEEISEGKETYAVSLFSGPCSSSRWTAVEKRFQKAGSRIPAMVLW
jgi:hypothetical protein